MNAETLILQIFEAAKAACNGTYRGMQEELGCSLGTLSNISAGGIPKADLFLKLVQLAGGAVNLPNESHKPQSTTLESTPANYGNNASTPKPRQDLIDAILAADRERRPTIRETVSTPILGRVSAGTLTHTYNDIPTAETPTVPLDPDLFRTSRLWSQTQGPVMLARVSGSSMSPDYPDGCLIALRAPKNPGAIRNNTPCIMATSEGQTFKLFRRSKTGSVFGLPINPDHDPVSFAPDETPEVPWVVLGTITTT